MQHTPSQQAQKKKRNKAFTIIPWVGLVLFILTAAAGGYLYATKKLVIATNGSAATATIVCDDAVVSSYNTASELKIRGSDTDVGTDTTALDNLDKTIRAKSGFEQDPTCQTILFWNAFTNDHNESAQTALTAIKKLHDEHRYADTNLIDITSISNMTESFNVSKDTQG